MLPSGTALIKLRHFDIHRCFSVGVTTAFGIVLRLDKLMVATKELVGEQYHIHGIGVPEPKSTLSSPIERPAKDA